MSALNPDGNTLLNGAFVESVRAYCIANRLLPPDGPLIAAVSGGADSVALFFVLLAVLGPSRLVAAHYNHRWRGAESDRDEAFVRGLANAAGVRFVSGADPMDPLSGGPVAATESAARTARYRFLEQLSDELGGCRIALAHHRDDQAETILLNLMRGTALRGLCGMRPLNGRRIRPLLNQPRRAIEGYLAAAGHPYCEDRTNALPVTPRNRIRHELLPMMADICGGDAARRLAETAEHLAADEAALSEQAAFFRAACGRADCWMGGATEQPDGSNHPPAASAEPPLCGLHFPLNRVRDLTPAVRSRVILMGIREVSGRHQNVTSAAVARAEQVLTSSDPAAVTDLCHGVRLIIQRNDFALVKPPPPFTGYAWLSSWASDWEMVCVPVLSPGSGGCDVALTVWQADASICRQTVSLIPQGLNEPLIFDARASFIEKQRLIDYNNFLWIIVNEPPGTRLTLRLRRPGDRYQAGAGRPARSIKQWMQERAIPLMWRDRVGVLALGDRVIWLPGIPGARFEGSLPPDCPDLSGKRGMAVGFIPPEDLPSGCKTKSACKIDE